MEREATKDIPDPEEVRVVQLGLQQVYGDEIMFYTTRKFVDNLRSGSHVHREENLSVNMLISPDPSPRVEEVIVVRSPHVLPPDEFVGNHAWWERRTAQNEDMREAVRINDPANPRRPDCEGEPRESRLRAGDLCVGHRANHPTILLGLDDVLMSCGADCGGLLPVGLVAQLFDFLPNLQEVLLQFRELCPGDLVIIIVATTIGSSHVLLAVDRQHSEALGRRDAFTQSLLLAREEAVQREFFALAVQQPPECSRGDSWKQVGEYYQELFRDHGIDIGMMTGTYRFEPSWMPESWKEFVEEPLLKDESSDIHPQKWINGLGRFNQEKSSQLTIGIPQFRSTMRNSPAVTYARVFCHRLLHKLLYVCVMLSTLFLLEFSQV